MVSSCDAGAVNQPTEAPDTTGHRSLPPVLVGLTLVVVAIAVDVTWLLVPWTEAPAPPFDPGAGLPPDTLARAQDVASALRVPALLSLLAGVLVVVVVVVSPPGRRLLGLLQRLPGGLTVTVPAQVLLVCAAVLLARLPFGIWSESVRRTEGLSVRGWTGFARDRLVAAGIEAVLLVLAVLALVLLARAFPRWWPAVAAGAGAGLVVTSSLLYPVLVEPAFARLTSLPDGPVREQVEELADRAGAPVGDVLVADTSSRATTLNAYVSGLGPTRRVVLQDTLLAGAPPDEVLSVVAHETAHAASGDVIRGTTIGALGTASAVLVLGCAALTATSRGRGPRGGVADGGAVGAVVLTLVLLQLVATPVESLVSRQLERSADQTAIELTADPEAFVRAQQTLLAANLSDPSPPAWVHWWFGTHPTGAERVAVGLAG